METKRCYICFGTPIYVLGVPFPILLSEIIFFVIFGLLAQNNLIVFGLIPVIAHLIFRTLFRKSERWLMELLFLINIPYSKIYKNNVAFLPDPPKL